MKAPTGSQVVGRVRSGRDLAARATGVSPVSPTSPLCMTRRTCLDPSFPIPWLHVFTRLTQVLHRAWAQVAFTSSKLRRYNCIISTRTCTTVSVTFELHCTTAALTAAGTELVFRGVFYMANLHRGGGALRPRGGGKSSTSTMVMNREARSAGDASGVSKYLTACSYVKDGLKFCAQICRVCSLRQVAQGLI